MMRHQAGWQRHQNGANHWERLGRASTHPSRTGQTDFLLASSVNGQVFCSIDEGDSWRRFSRQFGEVHALVWVPN